MSQRLKRMSKKIQKIGEYNEKEVYLNDTIDKANTILNQLQGQLHDNRLAEHLQRIINDCNVELDEMWKDYNNCMAYIYKENDANVCYDVVQMVDGTKLDVSILETNDMIIASSLGFIGKAKKHKDDKFNFEIGYQIALHRLMSKILNNFYGYKGE